MKTRSIAFAATAGALALAPSAQAGLTLGEPLTDTGANPPSCPAGMYFQDARATGNAGAGNVIPSRGVLTNWSVAGLASGNPSVRLKVADGDQIVAETAAKIPGPGVNSFNIRVPVQQGDRIGLALVQQAGNICAPRTGATGDVIRSSLTEVSPGQAFALPFSETKRRVNLSARWEGDRDRDGFGDDTQDDCPDDATTQGPCAPPPPPPPEKPEDPQPPAPPAPERPETPAQPAPPAPPAPERPAGPPAPDRPVPPVTTPTDGIAPSLRARVARRQRVTRSRRITARVTSSEAATLTASAKVNVRGVRLRGARANARAGRAVTLRVRASKRATRRLRTALARGRRVVANVTLRARDASGNQTTRRVRVRIVS